MHQSKLEKPVQQRLIFEPGALHGTVRVPGDKSISHRALILAADSPNPVTLRNLNRGRDVTATALAMQHFGASGTLRDPSETIDCMNSGSSARMLMGMCAGAGLHAAFDGDESLRRRPMEPVAAQLRAFGARIETTNGKLPAQIWGTASPQTRDFILLSPSAQVKSALLFAGVFGRVPITIRGDKGSRDHTERLLRYWDAKIEWDCERIALASGPRSFKPVDVAGDFSAAAFFIVAALVTPGSALCIQDTGVNPTRTGLLDALNAMGAGIMVQNERDSCGEPVADIVVGHRDLRGAHISPNVALRAIDEIQVLSVAAAFAKGETRITGIRDLRTKESDRVAAIARLLRAVRIDVEELADGIAIRGGVPRAQGEMIETHGDHRTAMSAAALAAGAGRLSIDDGGSIDVSFPGFMESWRAAQAAA